MSPAFVSVLSLLALVNRTTNDDTSVCAAVQTATPVVASGSPVTASCVIRDYCHLTDGGHVQVQWHLGRRLVPGSLAENGSATTSEVLIPAFAEDRAYLTCCVLGRQGCQVVGGVEIRAGFPPPIPQNLSCVTNLTTPSTLSCSWDPGRDSLPAQHSLCTETSEENQTYELPPGVHHYTIPRTNFPLVSKMKIYVNAVNALGQTTSEYLFLEPLEAAKLDPPRIVRFQAGPGRYGCLEVRWTLSDQQWVPVTSLEVRLTPTDPLLSTEQSTVVIPVRKKRPVEVCRLLHGTDYAVQMRVRYKQSPWTDWSDAHTGVTHERAPSGRLDSWMKVSDERRQSRLSAHLFWMPSGQFRANGKNVSYVVSLLGDRGQQLGNQGQLLGDRGQVCRTAAHHCAFQLPRGARRVFLSAVNAAGRSSPTDVPVWPPRGNLAAAAVAEVSVVPRGDGALRVAWTGVASSDITGYVVEWRPLCRKNSSFIFFDGIERNLSSVVISEGIEPYQPYGISVYPRYKHALGLPRTVEAYSRQKAPSTAPSLRVLKNWHSRIELTWDEIPISERNGLIRSYRVFYWDKQGNGKGVNADLVQRRVVLTDLSSTSSYRAVLMVSTDAGSLNGSEVILTTTSMDALDIVFGAIAVGVAVSLLVIITVLTCFRKHERLKMCFWPAVPDPANSTIKGWSTSYTMQDIIAPSQDIQKSSADHLSHLSLLDLSKAALEKGGVQTDEDPWLHDGSGEDSSDLGESISGSPPSPTYSGSQQDSVPYATVVFAGPYTSQPAGQTRVYLRSESSQPLLEEEPASPNQYQNTPGEPGAFRAFQDGSPREHSGSLWDDFPLLRALAMNVESEI